MRDSTSPLVCICIPTFNAVTTIRETIRSLLDQTYENLMIKVVDNSSTDGTLEAVEEFCDARISIVRHDVNVGGEGNFSRCISLGQGKYTAIFHADDVYENNIVSQQVAFLEMHPKAGAVFTTATLIDEVGHPFGQVNLPADLVAQDHLYTFTDVFKAVLKHSNFLICPSVMARTDVYQQDIRVWRGELFKSSADLDVWLRILQCHPVGILPEPLMRYRVSNGQGSAATKLSAGRADFFLVVDYYLALPHVQQMLTSRDLEHLSWLDRRDRIMRAANCLVNRQSTEVATLCRDIFSWAAFSSAFKSYRGLMTWILGCYLRLLLATRSGRFASFTLTRMKRLAHK